MIFTLCGSARFEKVWHEANKQLGLAGHISFSLMTFPSIEGDKTWYTPEEKTTLDLMHLAKIDASDAVLMLNVGDYLGESSQRELAWAVHKGKQVFFLFRSKWAGTFYLSVPLLDSTPEFRFTVDKIIPSQGRETLRALCDDYSQEAI